MYKFKAPTQTIVPKQDTNHHYLNLLDKCSQILREDRIWLRNQMKNGDEDLTSVFKSLKKPINMQHLQIKLRKYVTAIKSKTKIEQLNKFKQNLNMPKSIPRSPPSYFQKTQLITNNKLNTSFSRLRDNLNLNKYPGSYENFRSHSSQHNISSNSKNINETSQIYPYRNNSIRKNQSSQKKISPLTPITNTFHYQHEKNFPDTIPQQTQRESQITSNRQNYVDKAYWSMNNTENFMKKNGQKIITNNDVFDENEDMNEARIGDLYSDTYHDQEEQENKNVENKRIFEQSAPSIFGKRKEKIEEQQNGRKDKIQQRQFVFQQKEEKLINDDKNNLFTSPQLLNECRKFLNRSKSGSKTNSNFKPVQQLFKPTQQYKQHHQFQINQNYHQKPLFQSKNQHFQHQSTINNLTHFNNPTYFNYNPSYLNQNNLQTYLYPQQPKSIEKLFHEDNIIKRCEGTFTKIAKGQNIYSPHSHYDQKQQNSNLFSNVHLDTKINAAEQLIDVLHPYISNGKISFRDILSILPNDLIMEFKSIFRQYHDKLVSVKDLGIFLQERMGRIQNNSVKDIHTLLDIDQKGYVSSSDIQSFLQQLQDANVECLEQVATRLWKVYDMAHNEDGNLDYWNLYTIRESPQFTEVCSMLQQFQFQIEV